MRVENHFNTEGVQQLLDVFRFSGFEHLGDAGGLLQVASPGLSCARERCVRARWGGPRTAR